jgi:hypothetical protein
MPVNACCTGLLIRYSRFVFEDSPVEPNVVWDELLNMRNVGKSVWTGDGATSLAPVSRKSRGMEPPTQDDLLHNGLGSQRLAIPTSGDPNQHLTIS